MHIFPNFRIQCIGWSCSFLEWWSLLCAMRQRFRYKKSPFFDVSILPRLIDHHIHKYVVEVDRVHCSARVWLETRPGSRNKRDSARFLILWLEDSTSQSMPKKCIIMQRIFKKSQKESLKMDKTFVMPMSAIDHYFEKGKMSRKTTLLKPKFNSK